MSPGSTPFVSKLVPLLYQLESRMDARQIDLNELFATAKSTLTQFGAQDYAYVAIGLLGLLALVDLVFYTMAYIAGREAEYRSITKSVLKTGLIEFKKRDSNPFGLFIEPLAKLGQVEVFLPALDHIAAAAERWDQKPPLHFTGPGVRVHRRTLMKRMLGQDQHKPTLSICPPEVHDKESGFGALFWVRSADVIN